MKLKIVWDHTDSIVGQPEYEWHYPVVPHVNERIVLTLQVRNNRGEESRGHVVFLVESVEHVFVTIDSYAILRCRVLQVTP